MLDQRDVVEAPPGGAVLARTVMHALIVEDDDNDAMLVVRQLAKMPYEVRHLRVWTLPDLREQLATGDWDVVLVDYKLSGFDALDVIKVVQTMRADLPVIVVSGKVGEDTAVGTMIAGARDYVMKDNLRRLGPAVERELAAAEGARERRRVEAELAETRHREDVVINNAPIVFFAVNRAGEFTLTSGRALRSVGLNPGDNVGRRVLDLYADIPGVREHIKRVQAGESGTAEVSVRDVVLQISYVPTWAEDGSPNGFSGVGVDVTDQVKARTELQRSQEHLAAAVATSKQQAAELSRSNTELAKFAYVASHDLQEPLRKVSSFCQLLQDRYGDQLDPRAREYIRYAVDGALRMQELILALLEWSRVGNAAEVVAEVDCNDALHEALRNLEAAAEESQAKITAEHLPVVEGTRARMVQLFQNLIGNAIKFRGKRPLTIHVAAQRAGEGWRFSVSDNGIGIEPQYQERIFEVFQRLHTRDEYPGTGVGLSLCKKIVESRGGRMWVESQPGEGSTFLWVWPGGD